MHADPAADSFNRIDLQQTSKIADCVV